MIRLPFGWRLVRASEVQEDFDSLSALYTQLLCDLGRLRAHMRKLGIEEPRPYSIPEFINSMGEDTPAQPMTADEITCTPMRFMKYDAEPT